MDSHEPESQSQSGKSPESAAGAPSDRPNNSSSSAGVVTIGSLIDDRYEVLAHIGSGGMGEVYKVLDRSTQTVFALKMISPHLAEQALLAKRLEHEAQAAMTLVHGNIVSVYGVGKAYSGEPYLIMDYVEGESLESLLKNETVMTAARALPIFIQIAEALVHAQQKLIVHRDLKPSNILMTKTPAGTDMVKIVDFGIAKISDQDRANKTKLTQTGELLGTPLYMSPEQCTGDELDARSDIYSFGCIMYEVLSGRSPFAADNPVKVILKHLSETPQPLPKNAGISVDLKQVVMRCLRKNRFDRYQTAVELQIDLTRVLDGRKIRHVQPRFRFSRRHAIGAAAGAAVVGAVVCASLISREDAVQQSEYARNAQSPVTQTLRRPDIYGGKSMAQWTSEIEATPDDPRLYFARGELHSMRDERTNAIDDFTRAIKLKPDYLLAYRQRAFCYTMIAQYDKALQDANKLIALNPNSTDGYESRGTVFNAREQYAEAIADWKHAIALNDRPYFHTSLAIDELKLARYVQAEHQLIGAIAVAEDKAFSRGLMGLIYCFQQKWTPAFQQLKSATEASDGRGVEWAVLAYYYASVGKPADGEKAITQAKALETFPARGFRLAGEYYRTSRQYEKAIQEFSASTSLEEFPPGYRERAMTYIDLGQWRSAYEDLKKSLELNSDAPTTLSYMAMTESHLKMTAPAMEHIAQAFKAKALPAIVFVNRAAVELDRAETNKALDDVNEAIKRDPWLMEGYRLRSQVEEKLQKTSEAESDRIKASKLMSHFDI